MNYYKLRSLIYRRIKDHLTQRQELIDNGMNPPPFGDFQRSLMEQYGVTSKMVRTMIEEIVPNGTVINGEIVRR